LLKFVLQLSATELVESESVGDPAEQQPVPPVSEPCGSTVNDNLDNLCGSTLGRNDSTLNDAERQWLARFPCIDRQQLAELREAFLMLAVNTPAVTPRTAAAIADSARLDATDIGTCLRAVGQNPTQADIARITAVAASQQQQPEAVTSAEASNFGFSVTSSSRALFQAATKQQPAAGSGRVLARASDAATITRPSVDQTPATGVSVLQMT